MSFLCSFVGKFSPSLCFFASVFEYLKEQFTLYAGVGKNTHGVLHSQDLTFKIMGLGRRLDRVGVVFEVGVDVSEAGHK